jgi:hypothetical protein
MDLSPNSSSVYIANGLTATGVSGSGAGTVNLTGLSDAMNFAGTQTFSTATITLGATGSAYSDQVNEDDTLSGSNAVLTLASDVIVNANSTASYDYLGSVGNNRAGDGIVNQGTINIGSVNHASLMQIDPYNFTNQGTINVTNGSTLYLSPTTSLTDTGTLNATGGNIYVTTVDTGGGHATIFGTSQIQYNAASNEQVAFAAGSTGELLLLNSAGFTGNISGFTGSGTGAPATSDKLDLRDINFASAQFSTSYANNVLTVTDGTHTTNINFTGSYTLASFHFLSDGSGGTLVTDPPVKMEPRQTMPERVGLLRPAHETWPNVMRTNDESSRPLSQEPDQGARFEAQAALLRQSMAASFGPLQDGSAGHAATHMPEHWREFLVAHTA